MVPLRSTPLQLSLYVVSTLSAYSTQSHLLVHDTCWRASTTRLRPTIQSSQQQQFQVLGHHTSGSAAVQQQQRRPQPQAKSAV